MIYTSTSCLKYHANVINVLEKYEMEKEIFEMKYKL